MDETASAGDDNMLDFDMGEEDELDVTQASVMQAGPEEEQLLSLDDDEEDHLDLNALELESSNSDDDVTRIAPSNELSLEDVDTSAESEDVLDLELNLDEAPEPFDNVVSLDIGSDDEEDLGDDIFADVDEIGTKLDLAKAYVDMGDSDGARSILDEVLEEGDDTQKQQAEQLLQQMG